MLFNARSMDLCFQNVNVIMSVHNSLYSTLVNQYRTQKSIPKPLWLLHVSKWKIDSEHQIFFFILDKPVLYSIGDEQLYYC